MSATTDIVRGRYSTYQLKDIIGRGGNAVVYCAFDCATNTPVAVKKMTCKDDGDTRMWLQEVETLMLLGEEDCTYIIRYLDHMQSGKTFLIVEEFAAGGSLLQQLRKRGDGKGFEEREAARYVYQVVCGLEYIHSKNVVHRDLKCANVLLCSEDGEGPVKLSDFGLAGFAPLANAAQNNEDGEGDANPPGSVYWLSPELASGREVNPTRSSDIWALGCLCLELLTGKPPFYDMPIFAAWRCIAEGKQNPIPDTLVASAECMQFLKGCLAPERSSRPTAAELKQHSWFKDVRDSGPAPERHLAVRDAGEMVEHIFFSMAPEQRERWLTEGGLQKEVPRLSSITAGESFRVIRNFAYVAARCRTEESCFLAQLGETELWDYDDLDKLCTPDDLAVIFCCCCEMQDPRVRQYAPTHPRALRYLLRCRENNVAESCITALHRLLAGSLPTATPPTASASAGTFAAATGGSSAGGEETSSEATAAASAKDRRRPLTEEWRSLAQQRLLRDGGLLVLRTLIEEQCQQAFVEATSPVLSWPTLDRLFEILLGVLRHGGERWLLGRTTSAAVGGGGGGSGAPAAVPSAASASAGAGGGGPAAAAGGGGAGPLGGSSKAAGNPDSVAGNAAAVADASAGGGGGLVASTSSAMPADRTANGITHIDPASSGRTPILAATATLSSAAGTFGEAAEELVAQSLGTTPLPKPAWFLALEGASRAGCVHALPILLRFIEVAAGGTSEGVATAASGGLGGAGGSGGGRALSASAANSGGGGAGGGGVGGGSALTSGGGGPLATSGSIVSVGNGSGVYAGGTVSANALAFVQAAGVSLAGTLLLVATDTATAPLVTVDLVRYLRLLQREVPKAAQFLRDGTCSLPLLAAVVKRSAGTPTAEAILHGVLRLCEEDRMGAAAAGSGLMLSAARRAVIAAVERSARPGEVEAALHLLETLVVRGGSKHMEQLTSDDALVRAVQQVRASAVTDEAVNLSTKLLSVLPVAAA